MLLPGRSRRRSVVRASRFLVYSQTLFPRGGTHSLTESLSSIHFSGWNNRVAEKAVQFARACRQRTI